MNNGLQFLAVSAVLASCYSFPAKVMYIYVKYYVQVVLSARNFPKPAHTCHRVISLVLKFGNVTVCQYAIAHKITNTYYKAIIFVRNGATVVVLPSCRKCLLGTLIMNRIPSRTMWFP